MSTERLLVKEAFGEFSPGDRITDARTMKRVVASHPEFVLRESVEDEAEPGPDAPLVPAEEPAETTSPRKPGRVTRHTVND